MRPIPTIFLVVIVLLSAFIYVAPTTEAKVTLSYLPEKVIQGQPVEIIVKGTKKSDQVTITFAGVNVPMAMFEKKLIGFVPIDINKKPGTYEIKAMVKSPQSSSSNSYSEKVLIQTIEVITREKYQAPLGIPQKLGGNTTVSQKQLVDTLAIENQSLLNLGTAGEALWKKSFTYPVANPFVTDPYGYSRLTGAYTITHKGTDFRAPIGTEVLAVNAGVVKLAREGRNYGNTIVIDHGNGIMSFYMHLSEMKVKVGDKVTRDHPIALSGMTGYAESPHLHFTLRINDVSVDPVVFLRFWE